MSSSSLRGNYLLKFLEDEFNSLHLNVSKELENPLLLKQLEARDYTDTLNLTDEEITCIINKYTNDFKMILPIDKWRELERTVKDTELTNGLEIRDNLTLYEYEQTTGTEIKSVDFPNEEVDNFIYMLESLCLYSKIPCYMDKKIDSNDNAEYVTNHHITINPYLSQKAILEGLIHEMIHSILNHNDDTEINVLKAEVEAEAIAYLIHKYYNIESDEFSTSFIANQSTRTFTSTEHMKTSKKLIISSAYTFIYDLDVILPIGVLFNKVKHHLYNEYPSKFKGKPIKYKRSRINLDAYYITKYICKIMRLNTMYCNFHEISSKDKVKLDLRLQDPKLLDIAEKFRVKLRYEDIHLDFRHLSQEK